MQFFFRKIPGKCIVERPCRAEGEGEHEGLIGDARLPVEPGQDLYGVAYRDLVKARAGVVEVDEHGHGKIVRR